MSWALRLELPDALHDMVVGIAAAEMHGSIRVVVIRALLAERDRCASRVATKKLF